MPANRGPQPLNTLLDQTKGCECTDPRDRVYALFNFYPSIEGVRPDYTQKPREVFQDVVLRLLTKERDLDLLGHCRWYEDSVIIPTWAPDWFKPRPSGDQVLSHLAASHRYY